MFPVLATVNHAAVRAGFKVTKTGVDPCTSAHRMMYGIFRGQEAAWHQTLRVSAGLGGNPIPTSSQVGPIANLGIPNTRLRGFQKLHGRTSRAGNSALENGPTPLKRRIAGLGVGRPKGEEGRRRKGREQMRK